MKRLVALLPLAAVLFAVSAHAQDDQLPSAPAGQTWKLVWQDEFDGDKLDTTKWTPRPDGKRKGGWWSQEAVGLDGKGNLVIKTFMDGFRTFGLWWKSDEYVFYVDGKETWRSKAGGVCQVPEYMLLSDEIGNWAGDIAKARLPDQFLVDYVRVYDLVEKK